MNKNYLKLKSILIHFTGLILLSISLHSTAHAQLISYQKLATFSIDSLTSIVESAGLPQGLIEPQYEVDFYKVVYLSPYIFPDSLVQVSGAIAIPKAVECPLPLVAYGHGTQTRKSKVASQLDGGQWDINTIFASTGYVVTMTDYLGLGDSDPRIPIPPYSHGYSESNAMINILRAARLISDTLNIELNDQIFLFGYSQGGAATVSTVKEIQQNYANEFNITASAPMSGAYDFKDAQVDLISSNNPYPTPAYFPYIILSYQSVYKNLFTSPSEFLKSPYDTLLPPLYYAGNTGLGALNNLCDPVPRNMVIDSVMNSFLSDSTHPMRLNLLDNDLIRGWYPETPMKLFYCNGDDQVTYLNSENAYNAWTNAGAPFLEKADFGDFNHNACAPFALINAKNYFDSYRDDCTTGIRDLLEPSTFTIHPNPAANEVIITLLLEDALAVKVRLVSNIGMEIAVPFKGKISGSQELTFNTGNLSPGVYFLQVVTTDGHSISKKLVVQR